MSGQSLRVNVEILDSLMNIVGELVMRGAEAELGRQVLLVIQDPLTHIVRNSADHGIEGKEARTKAGKPTKGTINLEA